jgi:endonuclease YncB( thermonuclease family)
MSVISRACRYPALLLAPLLLTVVAGCSDDGSETESASRVFVKGARAMSGDSVEVFLPERTAAAIIGIEAPEGNTACGNEARAFMAGLIQDGVTLEQTRAQFDDRDRKLYHAFTIDGLNVGLMLLQEGLARTVDIDHRYQSSFLTAELTARSSGRGCVWDTSQGPVPAPSFLRD